MDIKDTVFANIELIWQTKGYLAKKIGIYPFQIKPILEVLVLENRIEKCEFSKRIKYRKRMDKVGTITEIPTPAI